MTETKVSAFESVKTFTLFGPATFKNLTPIKNLTNRKVIRSRHNKRHCFVLFDCIHVTLTLTHTKLVHCFNRKGFEFCVSRVVFCLNISFEPSVARINIVWKNPTLLLYIQLILKHPNRKTRIRCDVVYKVLLPTNIRFVLCFISLLVYWLLGMNEPDCEMKSCGKRVDVRKTYRNSGKPMTIDFQATTFFHECFNRFQSHLRSYSRFSYNVQFNKTIDI